MYVYNKWKFRKKIEKKRINAYKKKKKAKKRKEQKYMQGIEKK